MDNELLREAAYYYGRMKALELREDAPNLSDTEIIDREFFIPTWREGPQPLNAVISYQNQVYRIIQAHDSTGNPTWNPVDTPSLFSICHTKHPDKAKPWVQPLGTSGMYYQNDCYVDDEGVIWRQIYSEGNVYDAATLPERWEQVDLEEYEHGFVWEPWVQPIGAQDAYSVGTRVSHNNSHWISTVDNNVWEPGVYGWEQTD